MARRIHLQPHLSDAALDRRYWVAKELNEQIVWQIVWQIAQRRTATEFSAMTSYRAYWIGQIAKRYSEEEPSGMVNRRHTTSYLARRPSCRQSCRGSCALLGVAAARDEPRTGSDVAAWMAKRLGWSYLVRIRHSPQVLRPRHALADPEQQGTFKKTSTPC